MKQMNNLSKVNCYITFKGMYLYVEMHDTVKKFYLNFNTLMHYVPKWSDTLKILQQMLPDF